MIRIVRAAVAVCCTLLISACFPPVTTHPLGGGGGPDTALTGLWRAVMVQGDHDNNKAWFHFVPKGDGTMMVLIVSAAKTGDGDVMAASVTTAALGRNHYLNARLIPLEAEKKSDPEDFPPGTVPVLYRWNGKRLELFLMDENATKAAIAAGRIKGVVEPGAYGDARITADPKALNAFFASPAAAGLFTDEFAVLTAME